MFFHPTPTFCLKLLTSVSGSSSKRCRSCPRNYNTSTVYIILNIRNYHFFFVDQRWLVAIVHVLQPNAFLVVGILSQYSFYFFAALYHVVPCITAVKQTIIRATKTSRPRENEFFLSSPSAVPHQTLNLVHSSLASHDQCPESNWELENIPLLVAVTNRIIIRRTWQSKKL